MAPKIATGTSMNARQQNDSITPELSREMKNVREWKSMEGENKLGYSWFVKITKEVIYLELWIVIFNWDL
jgi:hypothetical protein